MDPNSSRSNRRTDAQQATTGGRFGDLLDARQWSRDPAPTSPLRGLAAYRVTFLRGTALSGQCNHGQRQNFD
jgi:hypothetical protein